LSLEKFPAFVELPKSRTNFSSPDSRVSSFIVSFRWVEFLVEFMDSEAFNFYNYKGKHKKLFHIE
jgi:archaellum component FlaD/FlaE